MANFFSRLCNQLLDRRRARHEKTRRHAKRHSDWASREYSIESLEQRQLLAITANLLADVNVAFSTSAHDLTAVGATAFFVGSDPVHGQELWRTNGGSAQATLVKDIRQGDGSSLANNAHLTNVGGTLYFVADDGVHGQELWKSDGTSSGTQMVADINPGETASGPSLLFNANGALYFSADDGVHGSELWTSNGTASGTFMVADINPGAFGSVQGYFGNVGGTVYFDADDGEHGLQLWKSNGTSVGTQRIPYRFYYGPSDLTGVGGQLFFADVGNLWVSDGNSAQQVTFFPTPANGYPRWITNLNGVAYFLASTPFGGGLQLWKSSGTSASNELVYDGYTSALTNVNGTLYFVAGDGQGGRGLWASNGVSSGTHLVASLGTGENGAYLRSFRFAEVGGELYFASYQTSYSAHLWKSDGTSTGTQLVAAAPFSPSYLTSAGGSLYLISPNSQVWKTDGSSSGTVLLTADPPSNPRDFTEAGALTFFVADSGFDGQQLWASDGTSSGTRLVKVINVGGAGAAPANLTNVGGVLYFTANDGTSGAELWRSNGTSSGTTRVRDIQAGLASSAPYRLTNVAGILYFLANDGSHGNELWRSNGTSSGTLLVKDINPGIGGAFGASPYFAGTFVNFGGTLLFTANDGPRGYELWSSNGTSSGTQIVTEINSGAAGSEPRDLTLVGSLVYFSANNGTNGREIWRTDGSSTGTSLVADIRPLAAGSNPGKLVNVNGALNFVANDGSHGYELWRTNGASSNTALVRDINPGVGSGLSLVTASLTNVGGKLFFAASDGALGNELWTSDGTSSGTALVNDINPAGGSYPTNLTNLAGRLFFSANDGAHGNEIWTSDGASSFTRLAKDIYPGAAASDPSSLSDSNGSLYFAANNGAVGTEPWILQKVMPIANAGGPYTVAAGNPLSLNANGSYDPTGPALVGYSWDINGDNVFSDATGATPTLSWSQLEALGVNHLGAFNVRVRVTDSFGDVSTSAPATLTVSDSPPTTTGIGQVTVPVSSPPTVVALPNYFSDYLQSSQSLIYSVQAISFPSLFTNVSINALSKDLNLSFAPGVLGTSTITIRAQNSSGQFVETTFPVTDSPPTASINGPTTVVSQNPTSFTLAAVDVMPANQTGNFTFVINWGDGSPVQQVVGPTGVQVVHSFSSTGSPTISVTATSQDQATGPAAFRPVNVVPWLVLPNESNPALNDLVWGGTSGADSVRFSAGPNIGLVNIQTLLSNGTPVNTTQTATNVTGRVIARGGAGNDALDAAGLGASFSATLDGGAGNNTLYGGNAGDMLIGGSDGAEGRDGNNVIVAGNGTNTIFGNGILSRKGETGGNNLIVGGSGQDTIFGNYGGNLGGDGGEGGQNLIVGGIGADTIYTTQLADGAEGSHGSIVVSGATSYGSSPSGIAALQSILAEWTSADPLSTKLAYLQGANGTGGLNGGNYLQPGVTAFNDSAVDQLFGDTQGAANWFLYTLAQDIISRTKPADVQTNLP